MSISTLGIDLWYDPVVLSAICSEFSSGSCCFALYLFPELLLKIEQDVEFRNHKMDDDGSGQTPFPGMESGAGAQVQGCDVQDETGLLACAVNLDFPKLFSAGIAHGLLCPCTFALFLLLC